MKTYVMPFDIWRNITDQVLALSGIDPRDASEREYSDVEEYLLNQYGLKEVDDGLEYVIEDEGKFIMFSLKML